MEKLNPKTILIIVLILFPVSCVGAIFWLRAEFRAAARDAEENWVITDVSQYSEIRNEWYQQWLIEHFPEQIPENATDVHLMYSPPFFQKGALLQLWLKLPKDEIKKLQAEYSEIVLEKGDERKYLSRSYPALSMYHKSDKPGEVILSAGYEVIVLGTESRDDGNHGHTYGVAINSLTSEILYWTETW